MIQQSAFIQPLYFLAEQEVSFLSDWDVTDIPNEPLSVFYNEKLRPIAA